MIIPLVKENSNVLSLVCVLVVEVSKPGGSDRLLVSLLVLVWREAGVSPDISPATRLPHGE